jgi:hypothetical protein
MAKSVDGSIAEAKKAATEVLRHNCHGPYRGLPRTAGWGYPEPYTRDLLISALGILTTGDEMLLKSLLRVLETLSKNQQRLGQVPSLVHDPEDLGASDCTPLFLIVVGLFRMVTGDNNFLRGAVEKAIKWMEYQSPSGRVLIGQMPTTDWRDEQWVLGYGLYVNTLVYCYLRILGDNERAARLKAGMERFTIDAPSPHRHVHEGLVLRRKPYYALWSFKVHKSERFDLLGNSLAILSGIASAARAASLISWIEAECRNMKQKGLLAVDLPPNFFPYIRPEDPDWMPRYEKYNKPGEYHNGGIWPFVCGFYIAALVAAGKLILARKKLAVLTELIRPARDKPVKFGFNEWLRAQDAVPRGQDWQSWSAAMYLYAAYCVENERTPFFEDIREDKI